MVDTKLFRSSHWREPKPSTFGDWCFTGQLVNGGIEFEFNGTYTDAVKAANEHFGRGTTFYVMP
jgi:hypothetical protein